MRFVTALRPAVLLGMALCTVLLMTARLSAQEESADTPSPESPKPALREQTIYVPYNKLRTVFEKEGRGVFVPYEKFQELWRAAQQAQRDDPEPRPPVDALIAEIDSRATAQADVLLVEATLHIELLKDGWHQIPLRLSDAAIRRATIGEQPARLVRLPDGGYALLVQRAREMDPARIELKLEYAKAIQKSPGKNSVSIQTPQAPVNRWEVRIPDEGVKIDIRPLIAATQPANEDDNASEKETAILAFVGAADAITIDWNPKSEGASGLAALVAVQAEQQVSIEEGVMRTRTRLDYHINRSELTQLEIGVPADHKVAAVFDANVRQWELTTEGDVQRITVHLFEPAKAQQTVTIDLERFLSDVDRATVAVPVVRAFDVSRQQGLVALRLAPTLRGTTAVRTGLLQLDTSELPEQLTGESWEAVYRYAALPFELSIDVEKIEPRIRVKQYVHAYLEPEQWTVDLLALYTVERAGVFQLPLDIPADYEVRQIRGQAAEGFAPAAVDAYHADPNQPGRWTVNLAGKAEGQVGLFVQLARRLDDPNLIAPTGKASSLPLAIPRVASTEVQQFTGYLVAFAPESLRVSASTQRNAQNVSFAEATEGVGYLRRGERFAAMREVLALTYARDDVQLTLAAERRKPQVLARHLLIANIESGAVRYDARFFYEIRYSPASVLRIDVPESISSHLRNTTPSMRDQVMNPQPDDVAEGYVAWQFIGETELIGEQAITLEWQQSINALGIGESAEVPVPRLVPQGTDRTWGQIVAAKSDTIDIRPSGELTGLRPIDPQHDLMPGSPPVAAARAFEFQQDWSLTFSATRYQLVEVKRTSIEAALLRMVVTRSDQVDVHALYRLQSARQRLEVRFPDRVDPDQSFDAQPLRINGQPVTLERGDDQQYYIPLVGQAADQPMLVELRYTVSGKSRTLDFPTFPEEPAVGQVYMSVYLPEELALLGTAGPWHLEKFNPWRVSTATTLVSRPPWDVKSDAQIYKELAEGIPVVGEPLSGFSVQGQRYLLVTLRPADPPQSALRLRTVDGRWLDSLLFIIAVGIAVAFLLRPVRDKLIAIGLVLTAIVLAGVFWPTAAMYLLDGKFVLAGIAVLLLWTTAEIVKLITFWHRHGVVMALGAGSTSLATPPPDDALAPVFVPADESPDSSSPQEEPKSGPGDSSHA